MNITLHIKSLHFDVSEEIPQLSSTPLDYPLTVKVIWIRGNLHHSKNAFATFKLHHITPIIRKAKGRL
jgi:hypothetical protein